MLTLAIFARFDRFTSESDFYRYARRLLAAFPTLPIVRNLTALCDSHWNLSRTWLCTSR